MQGLHATRASGRDAMQGPLRMLCFSAVESSWIEFRIFLADASFNCACPAHTQRTRISHGRILLCSLKSAESTASSKTMRVHITSHTHVHTHTHMHALCVPRVAHLFTIRVHITSERERERQRHACSTYAPQVEHLLACVSQAL